MRSILNRLRVLLNEAKKRLAPRPSSIVALPIEYLHNPEAVSLALEDRRKEFDALGVAPGGLAVVPQRMALEEWAAAAVSRTDPREPVAQLTGIRGIH